MLKRPYTDMSRRCLWVNKELFNALDRVFATTVAHDVLTEGQAPALKGSSSARNRMILWGEPFCR